ncbi:hypothetical protein AAFN47_15880 [Hoeflea sp. CAU 1731]
MRIARRALRLRIARRALRLRIARRALRLRIARRPLRLCIARRLLTALSGLSGRALLLALLLLRAFPEVFGMSRIIWIKRLGICQTRL